MTESEWLESSDPQAMLRHLGEDADPRKLRLYAVACCRQIWHLLPSDRSRLATLAAERFADGLATAEEMAIAWNAAWGACMDAARVAAWDAAWYASGRNAVARDADYQRRPDILRDLIGNPFRPVMPWSPPDWWRDEILALARDAYAARGDDGILDPARLAVLSDALEEAGCADEAILAHLRSPGPHYRGCWALDLVLCRDGSRQPVESGS